MSASISLAVIGQFHLLIYSWFIFSKWYLSRKLSISFKFSNFAEYRFSKYDLMIFWISSVSVVMSPISFLILLIWIFSLCLLVSLDKGLPILLVFLKNQLFVSLVLCIVFFVFILLISTVNLIISYCLVLLGVFSFCSSVFNCLLIH